MGIEHKLNISTSIQAKELAEIFCSYLGAKFEDNLTLLPKGKYFTYGPILTLSFGHPDERDALGDEHDFGFRPSVYSVIQAASEDANEAEELMLTTCIRFIREYSPSRLGIYRYFETPFMVYEPGKLQLTGVNPSMYAATRRALGEDSGIEVSVDRWFGREGD
jgi:hypothetical protein